VSFWLGGVAAACKRGRSYMDPVEN